MIFMVRLLQSMSWLAHRFGDEGEKPYMARAFDSLHQLPLMLGARAGNPAGNDAPLFCDEALELLFILVVDIDFFVIAEAARTAFAGLCDSARWSA
jgi:hypothetical protein